MFSNSNDFRYFLAMHYTPNIDLAFNSVEYIMRDVKNGWLIRYIHANGASMFFIFVYSHICRGLYRNGGKRWYKKLMLDCNDQDRISMI